MHATLYNKKLTFANRVKLVQLQNQKLAFQERYAYINKLKQDHEILIILRSFGNCMGKVSGDIFSAGMSRCVKGIKKVAPCEAV